VRTDPRPASIKGGGGRPEQDGLEVSVIVLDDIDRLLELLGSGAGAIQAAHQTLHAMSTLLAAAHKPTETAERAMQEQGARLSWAGRFLIIATTSRPDLLDGVGISELFMKRMKMPMLGPWSSARSLRDLGVVLTQPGRRATAMVLPSLSRPRSGSQDD